MYIRYIQMIDCIILMLSISIAVGYVKYNKKFSDIDSFIEAADEAMYRDKYKNKKRK